MADKKKETKPSSQVKAAPPNSDVKATFPQSIYIKNSDQRIKAIVNKSGEKK
ncbi:MAG: hypothetical protein V4580_03115 [Bacteroidota bacterium]